MEITKKILLCNSYVCIDCKKIKYTEHLHLECYDFLYVLYLVAQISSFNIFPSSTVGS